MSSRIVHQSTLSYSSSGLVTEYRSVMGTVRQDRVYTYADDDISLTRVSKDTSLTRVSDSSRGDGGVISSGGN